jgi:hypothetical protein
MNTVYIKSGKTGLFWLYGTFIGLPLSALLGSLYGTFLADFSDSFFGILIKLVLFTILFFLLFVSNLQVIKYSKSRNNKINLAFLLLTSVVSFYFSWISTGTPFLGNGMDFTPFFNSIVHPSKIIDESVTKFSTSPLWYFFVWFLELLGFFLIASVNYISELENVFCESCNEWVTNQNLVLKMTFDSNEQLKHISEENIEGLQSLNLLNDPTQNHISVNFHSCERCKELSAIDFDLITVSVNNGKTSEKKEDFSQVILLNSSQYKPLVKLAKDFQNSGYLEATQSNKVQDESVNHELETDLEVYEPVELNIVERFFTGRFWKRIVIISTILLLPTYLIEPFIGLETSIVTVDSKKKDKNLVQDGFENYYVYFYSIKSSGNDSETIYFNVPEVFGFSIKIGDQIKIHSTKLRNEVCKVELKDGSIIDTHFQYGLFYAMAILHFLVLSNTLGDKKDKIPSKYDKYQKSTRIQQMIVNLVVVVLLYMSYYLTVSIFI